MFRAIVSGLITPILRRPSRYQVAALCYRFAPDDAGTEVLIITSRDTGRWVLPKGWPKSGTGAAGTAIEEAWEEAGVKPRSPRLPLIGRYRYQKRLRGGIPVATDVDVFALEVVAMFDDFPEAGERQLKWVSPQAAAEAVEEPELQALLRDFGAQKLPVS
ncbi:NUDIX hydrolase [Pseudooceanicola sp. C21-150M6]|uniref:NUDIX hydrolase n=1 Tax=Pseudooceanicola sp. C21-150M6 TaxID=3434355 RepID=UPI003D7FEF0F